MIWGEPFIGSFPGPSLGKFPLGASYSAEATAYFAAMSVAPDATRKGHLNTLIAALNTAGVYAKLDWLTIHAAHDEQAARVNIINPAQVASVGVAPTFTTDRGHSGNGTTQYLDTGFNPSTAISPKFTRNDCHLGVWIGTNVQSATQYDIGNAYATLNTRDNPNRLKYHPQMSFADTTAYAATTSVGHTMWSRTTSLLHRTYRDGVDVDGDSLASAAVPNSSILIGAQNTSTAGAVTPGSFSTRRIQAVHFGSQLSAGESAAFHSALATYMTAVGA